MANVCIIGKKGSKSRKAISDNTGIKLYTGQDVDAIINYGLAGNRLDDFFKKFPRAKRIPIINRYVGRSKLRDIKEASELGLGVPESRLTLNKADVLKDWIEKKIYSSQGNGIIKARGRGKLIGKYYQKFVSDRKFELRVHAFLWVPKDEWVIHKRLGPDDQIAWNFHQGGYFQTVMHPNKYDVFLKAKDASERFLRACGIAFGAVDFVVDQSLTPYFIEVNSSPGFSNLSDHIYFSAMKRLSDMPTKEVIKYASL